MIHTVTPFFNLAEKPEGLPVNLVHPQPVKIISVIRRQKPSNLAFNKAISVDAWT